jgi:hypothetical protein
MKCMTRQLTTTLDDKPAQPQLIVGTPVPPPSMHSTTCLTIFYALAIAGTANAALIVGTKKQSIHATFLATIEKYRPQDDMIREESYPLTRLGAGLDLQEEAIVMKPGFRTHTTPGIYPQCALSTESDWTQQIDGGLQCLSCALDYSEHECPKSCCAIDVMSRDQVGDAMEQGSIVLVACEVGGCCGRYVFTTDGYMVVNEPLTAVARSSNGSCELVEVNWLCRECADAFVYNDGQEKPIDCSESGVDIQATDGSGRRKSGCASIDGHEGGSDTIDAAAGASATEEEEEEEEETAASSEPTMAVDASDGYPEASAEPIANESFHGDPTDDEGEDTAEPGVAASTEYESTEPSVDVLAESTSDGDVQGGTSWPPSVSSDEGDDEVGIETDGSAVEPSHAASSANGGDDETATALAVPSEEEGSEAETGETDTLPAEQSGEDTAEDGAVGVSAEPSPETDAAEPPTASEAPTAVDGQDDDETASDSPDGASEGLGAAESGDAGHGESPSHEEPPPTPPAAPPAQAPPGRNGSASDAAALPCGPRGGRCDCRCTCGGGDGDGGAP